MNNVWGGELVGLAALVYVNISSITLKMSDDTAKVNINIC